MFRLAATDAGLILGALKLSLCGFKAVVEKHCFETSLILCANTALGVFCTDHSCFFPLSLVSFFHLAELYHLFGHWPVLSALLLMLPFFAFSINHAFLVSSRMAEVLHLYWEHVQIGLQNMDTPLWWRKLWIARSLPINNKKSPTPNKFLPEWTRGLTQKKRFSAEVGLSGIENRCWVASG